MSREAKYKHSGRRGGRWVQFPRDPFRVGEFGGFDFPGVDPQCVNQCGITLGISRATVYFVNERLSHDTNRG